MESSSKSIKIELKRGNNKQLCCLELYCTGIWGVNWEKFRFFYTIQYVYSFNEILKP